MISPMPHEWEPDPREPAICVHCCTAKGEEGRTGEECPVRLRRALDAVPARGLRWEQHPNNPHAYHLILGAGPNEITIGRMLSGYDPTLGHSIMVSAGAWSELAKWTRQEAADYLCRRMGLDPVPM